VFLSSEGAAVIHELLLLLLLLLLLRMLPVLAIVSLL